MSGPARDFNQRAGGWCPAPPTGSKSIAQGRLLSDPGIPMVATRPGCIAKPLNVEAFGVSPGRSAPESVLPLPPYPGSPTVCMATWRNVDIPKESHGDYRRFLSISARIPCETRSCLFPSYSVLFLSHSALIRSPVVTGPLYPSPPPDPRPDPSQKSEGSGSRQTPLSPFEYW